MPHVEYYIEGVRYPSVTEILGDRPKPWLQKWKDKWGVLAERKTAAAAHIGTAFHALAEDLALGKPVYLDKTRRINGMLLSFDRWLKDSGFRIQTSEIHVVSNTYKYQGTFDATGWLSDHPKTLCLVDWKTSSGIYPEYAEQLAAYAQAHYEETGKKIRRGLIVHVSKDKPNHILTVKEYKLTKRLLNRFLKRLAEYNEART